jgi:hypothetical protein
MFSGCSKLKNIEMLATKIVGSHSLYEWVSGVAGSGTFIKHKSMDLGTTTGTNKLGKGSVSGIPSGWKIVYDFTVPGETSSNIHCLLEVDMKWSTWIISDYCKDKGIMISITSDGYVCATTLNRTAYLCYSNRIINDGSNQKVLSSDKITSKSEYQWMLKNNL